MTNEEVAELRAEIGQLQFEIERLIEDRDRPQVLPEHVQRVSENQLKLIADLRAEVERLRAELARWDEIWDNEEFLRARVDVLAERPPLDVFVACVFDDCYEPADYELTATWPDGQVWTRQVCLVHTARG